MSRIEEIQAQRRKQFAAKKGDDNAPGWAAELAEDTAELWAAVSQNTKAVGQGFQELRARLGAVEQHVANIEPGAPIGAAVGPSIGSQVVAEIRNGDSAFAHLAKGNQGSARFNLHTSIKAALTNTPGTTSSDGSYIPSDPERARLVGQVLRPLTLLEALPSRPTTRDAVEYVQLATTTDAAEQAEEGDAKQEADFTGTLKRAEICTIALWTACSKQVLADHVALQGEIDRVIRGKCWTRLEELIVNGGTGTDANSKVSGLLDNKTTFVPTVGGNDADILGEAVSAMRTAGYMPDLIVMNPKDWHSIAISKTAQTEDYLLGKPTIALAPSLWGLPVVQTPALAEGTALVIDRSHVTVLDREQAAVQMSNSHSDFFVRNLVAVLAEIRSGLEIRDTAAVYSVDISGT